MKIQRCSLLTFTLVLAVCSSVAQTKESPAVSKVFAKLTTQIEAKTATKGDEVHLITINDIVVSGRTVVPKGTTLLAHVGGVITKGKDEPETVLAIFVDKAIVNGKDIPLQAIIVAIAAPKEALTDDPTYGMMHSNEPKMVGSGTTGVSSSGTLSTSSKSNSTAAVATAQIKGAADPSIMLNEDSQGAIGYDGVSISWHLSIPPPLTVFSTKAKNLKLSAGTQMLLRMVPPQVPN